MKNILFKGIAVFFILIVATSVMMDSLNAQFGTVNFFDRHGYFFLLFITLFPRLTLLFSSVATGGFFWWLGFIFCPRILVASLATVAYFHTNPMLVTVSWIVALGGETMEKLGLSGKKKSRFVFRTYQTGGPGPFTYQQEEAPRAHTTVIDKNGVIDAEFTKKD